METKHYLSFLQGTMHRRWDNLALADFDGVNRYNSTLSDAGNRLRNIDGGYAA